MIEFIKKDDLLIGKYEPHGGAAWIFSNIVRDGYALLKKTFKITESDFYHSDDEEERLDEESDFILFKFAIRDGDYYKISRNILDISSNIYIHTSIGITQKMFLVERNVSIFAVLEKIKLLEDIYIGGPKENAISIDEYMAIINAMPNNYELEKYSIARVSSVLRKYFDTTIDGVSIYEKYINGKDTKKAYKFITDFADFDLIKYKFTISTLKKMLENEEQYSENDWQDEILKIITIVFPKYINAVKEAPVRDYVYNTTRNIDILLVDADGSVDIIEIKKPFDQCIVTNGKYRDNHIPLRDLSGTVMQVEKYIYHLNKWGTQGECKLTEKYKDQFPEGFKIKIINPKGLIIMGRSNNLTDDQKHDFEIIKRKYNNILDIMTYDDLIQRLEAIVSNVTMHLTHIRPGASSSF